MTPIIMVGTFDNNVPSLIWWQHDSKDKAMGVASAMSDNNGIF